MKIVNVNVKLNFPDDYTDEQICDIITNCDYEFNYPTNGGVNEVRPIDSEITNWEIGAKFETKEQKPVHNEYYVLVQFPEDTSYFEENEIGYPSFESEDNGGRFVSQDDYIRISGKEPDPTQLYKPVCWPESQDLMKEPNTKPILKKLIAKKALMTLDRVLSEFPYVTNKQTMSPAQIKKYLGISYLGGCNSPKLIKSKERNVMTYGVYLALHNLSGYNVCPQSGQCHKYCLHGSGRNKIELLRCKEGGPIQQSRIKKTKLFFEDRTAFMTLLCHEVEKARLQANKENMKFAVRLNCTSDISLEQFTLNGKNILEIYPDVQFYDYTKVFGHIALTEKYSNYDLTFSFSGDNWQQCEALLNKGHRIAVVFENSLPETFRGYPVINAIQDDARFLDAGSIICGLTYKKVANDYATGKYQRPDTVFINRNNANHMVWCSKELKAS